MTTNNFMFYKYISIYTMLSSSNYIPTNHRLLTETIQSKLVAETFNHSYVAIPKTICNDKRAFRPLYSVLAVNCVAKRVTASAKLNSSLQVYILIERHTYAYIISRIRILE